MNKHPKCKRQVN